MAIYLPQTLESLVRRGANVVIDEAVYLPATLVSLAYIAKQTGSQITISGSYLPQTLEELAGILGKQLTVVVRRAT